MKFHDQDRPSSPLACPPAVTLSAVSRSPELAKGKDLRSRQTLPLRKLRASAHCAQGDSRRTGQRRGWPILIVKLHNRPSVAIPQSRLFRQSLSFMLSLSTRLFVSFSIL